MKLKKAIAVFTAMLTLMGAASFAETSDNIFNTVKTSASEAVTETYGDLSYIQNGDTITIVDCNANATYVVIPEIIDSCTVTKIADSAFKDCTKLVGVVIPETVKSIGLNTFEGCTLLSDVTLPESVPSISGYMFKDCTSLEEINIPDTVTSVGFNSFDGCTSLKSIKLPEILSTIGSSAFKNCTSMTEVIIPDNVLSIGDSAYEGCSTLKSIKLGNKLKVLGGLAFADCKALEQILIPKTVTSIGDGIFRNSQSLNSLVVEDGNTKYISYENVLFNADKTKLVAYPAYKKNYSYSVPKTVTEIGAYAFYGNKNIYEISFPNALTTVGEYAFNNDDGDSNIGKVFYESSEDKLEKETFIFPHTLAGISLDCSIYVKSNKNILLYIAGKPFEEYTDKINLTWEKSSDGSTSYGTLTNPILSSKDIQKVIFYFDEDTIESAKENIGKYVYLYYDIILPDGEEATYYFINGDVVNDECIIDISNNITEMGNIDHFSWRLHSLSYDQIHYAFPYAVSFSGDGCTGILSNYMEEFTVSTPDISNATQYEKVYGNKYDSNFGICGADTTATSIIIPDKIDRLPVTAIEENAFYGCRDLENVAISDNVATIGKHAFYQNCDLDSVVIPYSVSEIADGAFDGCTDLKDVYYNGSEEEWNAITIGFDNECLTNATIHFNSDITTMKGDLNGDCVCDSEDVTIMQEYLSKKSDKISTVADLNGDGSVNVFDLALVKRIAADNI